MKNFNIHTEIKKKTILHLEVTILNYRMMNNIKAQY